MFASQTDRLICAVRRITGRKDGNTPTWAITVQYTIIYEYIYKVPTRKQVYVDGELGLICRQYAFEPYQITYLNRLSLKSYRLAPIIAVKALSTDSNLNIPYPL